MASSARTANALLILFYGVVASVILYIYYFANVQPQADLRLRVENKLFDLRTRLAPDFVSTSQIGVVEINANSSDAAINSESGSADEKKDFSYVSLKQLIDNVLRLNPRKVILILHPQTFPYQDPSLGELTNIARHDNRLIFGTFGLEKLTSDSDRIPHHFQKVPKQIYAAANSAREFRRNVDRQVVIYKRDGLQMLPWHIAESYGNSQKLASTVPEFEGVRRMHLNHTATSRIKNWGADDILSGDVKSLENKIIYIGHTDYRHWTYHDREATHIRTPWQSDKERVSSDTPLVYLQAMAGINIVEESWLTSAPLSVNVVQTVLVAIFCLCVWRFSVGLASLLIIGFWSLLLVVHALLFSLANLYIPIADAIFFSTIFSLTGAFWKLRIEGRNRALQEARAFSERELAKAQERFLDRFATELAKINDNVYSCLNSHRQRASADLSTEKAFSAALDSCKELGDYLCGIEQFARVTGDAYQHANVEPVDLREQLEKILRQFEARREEKSLTIKVSGDKLCAQTDRTLFTQIVFNLISNAIKYSPEHGQISISLSRNAREYLLAVTDNGPGITEDDLEKIFEKFYRVKDDNVYKIKGHGLGLYLSRYFASRMGASIGVVSSLGKGSTFTLRIPVRWFP